MLILSDGAISDDGRVLALDEPPPGRPALVSLAAWPALVESGHAAGCGVVLAPDADPEAAWALLRHAAVIAIPFAPANDGRGYSLARLLRRLGYAGDLRALGEIGRDQAGFMRRCGFSSYALRDRAHASEILAGLDEPPAVYQPAADGRVPIARLRAARA